MKTTTKLWIGIGVLGLLSPLGVFLPACFQAGDAWGEWGAESIRGLVGYIPRGLERLSGIWSAPISDYALPGLEEKGLAVLSFAYIGSAFAGIIIICAIMFLIARLLRKK